MELSITLSIIISLLVGILIGRYLLQMVFKKQERDANQRAESIIKEAEKQAEHTKRQRQLEAKEKFLQLKAEHEREITQRN
ncbi:MAG TPA: Rnase Y domain-containing protein, partial [Cytophagaceae bacterium]